MATNIRSTCWLPLDEVFEMLLEHNPLISRSSVYRCFAREGINRVQEEKKDEAKKFKAYQPGYLHMDVIYLPEFSGKPYYLFVAIDGATGLMFYAVHEHKTAQNTEHFLGRCLGFSLSILPIS